MQTIRRPTLDRTALRLRYLENRNRTAELFSMLDRAAYDDRPIELRHPFVFYDGHLPGFSFTKLCREALGEEPVDAELERFFDRGIDPHDGAEASTLERRAWPDRTRVQAFANACDARVLHAIATADLTDVARSPMNEHAEAVYTILEHEELHHETLLYMIHRFPLERKRTAGRLGAFREAQPLATGRVAIPAGRATLGAVRGEVPFGWDNEFPAHAVDVPAFDVDVLDVTNGDWLAFVRAGGPVPSFWRERDGGYALLGMFEEMPLPLTWPVYVSQEQAAAYAEWIGRRLPTEAEYHRAAFGTPEGEERALPWGDAAPTSAHGNFGFRRHDPEPVGTVEAGKSAWGVYDLVGNGWEWTSTPFAPFDGFSPHASYLPYSTDFFDGEHYVIKGASPVTSVAHVRGSLRNWYRRGYPFMYATFRTVSK